MPPAGTADADTEVATLVPLIEWDQKPEEFLQMFQELTRHGIAEYILLHSCIFTSQRFQLRNKKWITNEANIEEEIDIIGHANL